MYLRELTSYIFQRYLLFLFLLHEGMGQWSEWWVYRGYSGPSYWGIHNKAWRLCNEGKYQSPIDISPGDLLYDPGLKHIRISGNKVSATLQNMGNDVTMVIEDGKSVNFTLGPLSYIYRLKQIKIHFGRYNGNGTEHSVAGRHFDAEIQLMAYNADLFEEYAKAAGAPKGLAIITLFAKTKRNVTHTEIDRITSNLHKIQFRDSTAPIKEFAIQNLLPTNLQYMTYEGSLTQPACHETVTWIIINRPIFIGQDQMDSFRTLRQLGPDNPQLYMYDNIRPKQAINRRTVRTNINVGRKCSIEKKFKYKKTAFALHIPP